jgi:hypothetical protein
MGGLWVASPAGGRPALAPDPVVVKALSDRVETSWRQGLVAPGVAPSYADDNHFRSWWRRWEAYSASPRDAAALRGWAASVDPAPILPAIQAPTLVLETGLPLPAG